MDDPTKPKRLDEAITMVGTCQDMCPEFERYRRAREKNLDKWECVRLSFPCDEIGFTLHLLSHTLLYRL